MTALDHPTHAIAAETRPIVVVKRVANGFRAFFRSVLARREVSRLGNLSDHELADIGLKRADLAVARRLPLGVDPTVRLSDFARERYLTEDGARRVC